MLDPQEGSFSVVKDAKVPWSDEETLHLLDIWGKDSVQRALKGCLKNRHIFTQIAQKMAERGYMRSVEQCQTRIKRLKKYFRQNHKWVSKRRRVHSEIKLRFPQLLFFCFFWNLISEPTPRWSTGFTSSCNGYSAPRTCQKLTRSRMTWRNSTMTRSPETVTRTCRFSAKRFTEKLVCSFLKQLFLITLFFFFCKTKVRFDRNRDSEHSVDRLGDVVPHQHVGGRHAAAGAEDDAQNRTHLHHHIQQDGRPGLLQDARAVPDTAEEAQAKLQAELP